MLNKKEVVWDIEGNGLLPELSEVWMLCTKDIHTGSELVFTDHDNKYPNMDYGVEYLDSVTNHIGHNLFGYDISALKKIYGWELKDETKVTDTWILSLLNRYKRGHAHGLAGWGQQLGYPKGDYDDWSHYNHEMLRYCKRDVELNEKVYKKLHKEASGLINLNPLYSKRIEIEMFVARMNMKMVEKGWIYDQELSTKTQKELNEKMKRVEREIEPKLGTRRVYKDKAPKTPKYTKKGLYTATTARLLSEHLDKKVIPEDALSDNPPIKPTQWFQRYEDVPVEMGNMKEVKEYLMSIGWKPDEWNRSKESGRWRNTTPKLEGPALEAMGDIGKGVSDYYMMRHRRSAFEGFDEMANKRGDGRINGNMWCIGTPTFRVRHEGIVNLPGVDAPYGKELRSLFTCEDDRVIIGADSAGNQLRGFCHVMKNDDYTAKILGDDAHQFHADMIGSTRKEAKVFIYRILFGSTAWGLGKAFGKTEAYAQGLIDNFKKEVPEFDEEVSKLEEEWQKNQGWIFGETGNILFVDEQKKVLNAYLQDLEKVTCAASMMWSYDKMKEEGIDFYPTIFYHDEDAFAVKKEHAEKAAPIIAQGFTEGPKLVGVQIMAGGKPCIGKSYADVH